MKKRSLFAAVAMLVVSAVLLTSATYAWFTAGGDATITGVSANVSSVDSGVMLKAANGSFVGTLAENTTNFPASGDYLGVFPSSFKPCSSADGKAFVAYTVDRTSGGFVSPVTDCSQNYYKEYTFDVAAVKANDAITARPTITGDAAASARVALIKLVPGTGGAADTYETLGVWSSDGAATQAIALNSGSAYDLSGLNDNNTNSSNIKYVADTTDGTVPTGALVDQGVSGSVLTAGNTGDWANVFTPTLDYLNGATVANGSVARLTVRIWIEGQDPQCAPNSAYCPGEDLTVAWAFHAGA